MAGAAALDALRARIRALEGGAPIRRRRAPCGVEALDALVGGLPTPGILELSGHDGSGRARVALAAAARATSAGRAVAWVDPLRRFYPPGAVDHGVDLDRMLLVRPPEDGSSPWAWTSEQLLRSGCFPLVVVDLPSAHGGARERTGTSRRSLAHAWARAAEHGGSTAIVLVRRSMRELPADVRLSVGAGRLFVLRDRERLSGGERALPEWPLRARPWGPL